ncbi:MAG TPA: SCO family protein [Gammaproteobacteria bacterium]|nr:SCO family protein [Gammaproteobacteria bacterium]
MSNQKIIVLVVFLCSTLMASLFVYHLRHQSSPTLLANDQGMVFSVARPIKSFQLSTSESKLLTEQNFRHHWTLLFFGFTHCTNVCPVTLNMLKNAYEKLHLIYPNLQIILISLDPERDHLQTLSHYTHSFHPDFIGATGQIQEIHKLQSQLGIFSARDHDGTAYQIQHTSSILLINPQGKWAGLFKYGMNSEQFSKAFIDSINVLGRY